MNDAIFPQPSPLPLDSWAIRNRIHAMASDISTDYVDVAKETVIVPIMNGAFFFVGELYRAISRNLAANAMFAPVLASGYMGETRLPTLKVYGYVDEISHKHVLLLEDIVDTGRTVVGVIDYLRLFGSWKSMKIATLLDKQIPKNPNLPDLDYVGFAIPDVFVVGYGMDYHGRYRGMNSIVDLEEVKKRWAK